MIIFSSIEEYSTGTNILNDVSFSILQSLAVATLGDKQMAQKIDNLVDEEEFKRFYLQVGFPCLYVTTVELMVLKPSFVLLASK